jgi:hypothetical protein
VPGIIQSTAHQDFGKDKSEKFVLFLFFKAPAMKKGENFRVLCLFLDKGSGGQFYKGRVAQWTSHPPKEQKTRVRILPGCFWFLGKTWQCCCVYVVGFCVEK